jgi:hypothetical protein
LPAKFTYVFIFVVVSVVDLDVSLEIAGFQLRFSIDEGRMDRSA